MMRWGRAARLLQAPAGARVLDVGCAFGFGTARLKRRYRAVGVDASFSLLHRARGPVRGTLALARAERLPFANAAFDAVVCLEVLEHVQAEAPVLDEIRRVLKPRGELVLSVPNLGLLANWDSINVFGRLTGRELSLPLGEPPSGSSRHRHYRRHDLEQLLTGFVVNRVVFSGSGLAEVANLVLLAAGSRAYTGLQYLYFALAALDDQVLTGRRGYNIMLHARKTA